MLGKVNCIAILLLGLFTSGWGFLEHDSWITVELQHALSSTNPEQFSDRGNITIASLNSGQSNVVQDSLTKRELESIKVLAKRDDFYRVKATVVYPNGNKQQFLTSTKACSLLQAQFNDILWISLDANGFVTGITTSQDTVTKGADCGTSDVLQIQETSFNTDVIIRHSELAPVPDTGSFIQKFEREAKERGEVRDNRGFFAKYWMYIVPVVLLVLISGATNQDAAK
ncbi:CG32441 [Drosophila busckii]|uniref:ER membrane protein complex subunit 10 n=1 Tax=Drosophila busckii TaxID=30019 RepID=A0A0M4EQ11_DROBS|nr:ER membrane protein complex subunit 10 [Drosophila busckii]ALC47001.1 CG32441 [Drosophila busckii]